MVLVGQARARVPEDLGADPGQPEDGCDKGHVNRLPSVLSSVTKGLNILSSWKRSEY